MRIWVVEMWDDFTGKWETIGWNLQTRERARFKMAEWKRTNPSDKFRVWPYVPEAKK